MALNQEKLFEEQPKGLESDLVTIDVSVVIPRSVLIFVDDVIAKLKSNRNVVFTHFAIKGLQTFLDEYHNYQALGTALDANKLIEIMMRGLTPEEISERKPKNV